MPRLFLPPAAAGRRVVLWSLACFLVGQVTLSLYLERRRPELRDPLYGYRLLSLRERLAEAPGAPLFLVLGSSRVKYSVRPAEMQIRAAGGGPAPVVYNFGVNGMGTIRELMYFRRLLADGVRPTWLLLELWPPLWAEAGFYRESRMVLGEDDLHWRDLPLAFRYFRQERDVLRLAARKCLLPVSDYRSRLLEATLQGLLSPECAKDIRFHMRDWVPADADGWSPLPWGAQSPEALDRAFLNGEGEVRPLVDPLRIDPRSDAALHELLAECRRHQVRVAAILMPEPSRTRSWYSPQARGVVRDYLGRLRREHDLPIIDARGWVADEDFADHCHMANSGVPGFCRRLGREVIRPLVDGRAPASGVLFEETLEGTSPER